MPGSGRCYLCGSTTLELFEQLPGGRCATTDGHLLDIPLRKYQCVDCTLVQSDPSRVLEATPFSYESSYDFYSRPLMRDFEKARYQNYADWVTSFLAPRRPANVLEVGCGQGWVLELLRESCSTASLHGLEPSAAAVRAANDAGLDVRQGELGKHPFAPGQFDFIYCINVFEHVADPIAFMRGLHDLLGPHGAALVICPCANVIDPELLFADHIYSYSRANLRQLARLGGFAEARWEQGRGMQYAFQAICCTKQSEDTPVAEDATTSPWWPDADLAAGRRDYFRRWAGLERLLLARLPAEHVVCFGAGETTDLLRAHAPRCWNAICAHMIDQPNGADPGAKPQTVKGLPVRFTRDYSGREFDAILLGIKPRYQCGVSERLKVFGKPIARWDDVIPEPFA